jgi:hypothetical protein
LIKNFKPLKIEEPAQSEIMYSRIIPKYDKTGRYHVGSLKIEVKKLLQAKFIQLTQEKAGFANNPSKISTVTLDLTSKETRDRLIEALEFYETTTS